MPSSASARRPSATSSSRSSATRSSVYDQPLLAGNIFIFNTRRKPFDDIRVRQALTLAVDRWTGGENIGKISSLRYVGGVEPAGLQDGLAGGGAGEASGLLEGCGEVARTRRSACSRRPGRRTWPSSFSTAPASRATRPAASTPSTSGAASASRQRTSSSRPSSTRRTWRPGISTSGMEFISDYLDDPTQNFVKFLSKKLTPLGYSGHEDTQDRRPLREAARARSTLSSARRSCASSTGTS